MKSTQLSWRKRKTLCEGDASFIQPSIYVALSRNENTSLSEHVYIKGRHTILCFIFWNQTFIGKNHSKRKKRITGKSLMKTRMKNFLCQILAFNVFHAMCNWQGMNQAKKLGRVPWSQRSYLRLLDLKQHVRWEGMREFSEWNGEILLSIKKGKLIKLKLWLSSGTRK